MLKKYLNKNYSLLVNLAKDFKLFFRIRNLKKIEEYFSNFIVINVNNILLLILIFLTHYYRY